MTVLHIWLWQCFGPTPSFLYTYFAYKLFVSNQMFCIFLSRFEISVKFCVVLIPMFKFFLRTFFGLY
jgi:hypothetical protein